MKFKQINESTELKKFVENLKEIKINFIGIDNLKNLNFETLDEENGGDEAIKDVEKYLTNVINGQYTLRLAFNSLRSMQKLAVYRLERSENNKKKEYYNGYLKIMDSVLYDLEVK